MTPISEFVICNTGTPPDWHKGKSPAQQLRELRRWDVEFHGMEFARFHWLLTPGGKMVQGRPPDVVGEVLPRDNEGRLFVALVGGHYALSSDALPCPIGRLIALECVQL